MEYETARRVNAKVKAVIWHLVTRFPHAAILSRQVEGKDHHFTIIPHDETPEKEIQIAQALLANRTPNVPELRTLLYRLHIATILQECDRYHLTRTDGQHQMAAWLHPPTPSANAGDAHRHDARPATPL